MIRIVNGGVDGDRDLDAMYRGRKSVFSDRLKWPVALTEDGREIDQFDALDPLYLIATDRGGAVKGSLRLMPTTGPTLLNDVFGQVFDEPVDLRSATIWEATRFCVHHDASEVTITGANRATSELALGLAEVALRSGLTQIIAIYDDRMIRVYRRIGWEPDRLATSLPSWSEKLHVGLWEVSPAALLAMQIRNGIMKSVLADEPIPDRLRRAG